MANTGGGMMTSGTGCCVMADIVRLCHSYTNSILWCVIKVTKATTWSHSSAILSIIGTKLSSVRGCSSISCRVVITSSQYSWNARKLNRMCQWSSSHPLSWLIRGFPLVSCGKGMRRTSHGQTLSEVGRNLSVMASLQSRREVASTLLSSFQRAGFSHLRSVTWLNCGTHFRKFLENMFGDFYLV